MDDQIILMGCSWGGCERRSTISPLPRKQLFWIIMTVESGISKDITYSTCHHKWQGNLSDSMLFWLPAYQPRNFITDALRVPNGTDNVDDNHVKNMVKTNTEQQLDIQIDCVELTGPIGRGDAFYTQGISCSHKAYLWRTVAFGEIFILRILSNPSRSDDQFAVDQSANLLHIMALIAKDYSEKHHVWR